MRYRIGDDSSGQTIYDGTDIEAIGCSPESAQRLVERLNSEPARQADVDLLRLLLAEQQNLVAWYHRSGELLLKQIDQSNEQLDAARATLAFWSAEGRA